MRFIVGKMKKKLKKLGYVFWLIWWKKHMLLWEKFDWVGFIFTSVWLGWLIWCDLTHVVFWQEEDGRRGSLESEEDGGETRQWTRCFSSSHPWTAQNSILGRHSQKKKVFFGASAKFLKAPPPPSPLFKVQAFLINAAAAARKLTVVLIIKIFCLEFQFYPFN